MRSWTFFLSPLAVGLALFAFALGLGQSYLFFAGYVVLQYVVLATAWNILGGYCGYVNFGSAAFFAPLTLTVPRRGLPPRTTNLSMRPRGVDLF